MRNLKIIWTAAFAMALTGCGNDKSSSAPDTDVLNISQPGEAGAQDIATIPVNPAVPDKTKTLAPAPAGSKSARCKITSGTASEKNTYAGACIFLAEENGSFSVSLPDQKPFFDGIGVISLAIGYPGMESGEANIRGLTQDGINSNWGNAKRDTTDKACWNGEDFQICAY